MTEQDAKWFEMSGRCVGHEHGVAEGTHGLVCEG